MTFGNPSIRPKPRRLRTTPDLQRRLRSEKRSSLRETCTSRSSALLSRLCREFNSYRDEVEVDEDSLDAKAWLEQLNQLGKPTPPSNPQPTASSSTLSTVSTPSASTNLPSLALPEPLPVSLSSVAPTTQPKPGPKPGPKRPRTNLASLSASLNAKPTKLTTLEKSKMDWDK